MAETDALLSADDGDGRKTPTVIVTYGQTQNNQAVHGDVQKEEQPSKVQRTWRHFMLPVVLTMHFFGGGFASYIVSEWIHERLTDEASLGNTTAENNRSHCLVNKSDVAYKAHIHIQQTTSQWQMYYESAFSASSFLATVFLPPLTDFYGRKFLIVGSLFAIFIKRVALVFIVYFNMDFIYIVISYGVEGLFGGSFGLLSATFSCVADLYPQRRDRTLAIVGIDGMLVCCGILSGLGIGFYIQYYGYIYPSITSAGTAVLALLVAVLIIPETLKSPRGQVRVTPLKSLQRLVGFYTSKEFKGQRLQYMCLLMAFIMRSLSMQQSTLETTYQLGMPFCWSPSKIGYFSSLKRFAEGVIGVGSIKFLQRCLPDEIIAILSMTSTTASFILEAFATTDIMMFMVPVVSVYSFLAIPVIRSIMSLMAPETKQGALFAGIALMEVIGSVAGSVVDNNIYMATVSFMNGFVFLALGGFNAVALIFLVIFAISKKKVNREKQLN